MCKSMNHTGGQILLLMLVLVQVTPALARNDNLIQREIEAQVAASSTLSNTRITVRVEDRLVVLTGQVSLYEQKLVSERIAWTTAGVFEVENELQVKPKVPRSDAAIERRVSEIVKMYKRFHAAELMVAVDSGTVSIEGTFSATGDPVFLKHKVAEIEGVLDINIDAAFLAGLAGNYEVV